MYTLFIVDDREIFRRQFKRFRIFQDNSRFQVRFEAQNGQEALEILRREQVDIMRTVGCDSAQGFWFSKAIPAEEFREKYMK